MARLPGAAGIGPVADRIRDRRGGDLHPLDELLLLSPPVADGWNALLGAIRGQLRLDPQLRELAILRIAVLNGAAYEWHAHEPCARQCGVPDAKIAAVRDGPQHPDFTPAERAVLAYTDTMTREVTVSPEVYGAVENLLPPRELAELTATVAAYNMVSRFLVALEITPADIRKPAGGDRQ
jgi:4-carboxymuconolactone decarboxylase